MVTKQGFVLILYLHALVLAGKFGSGLSYNRPPPRENLFVKLSEDYGSTTPQQVHISMAGEDKMRITWITRDPTPPIVEYGTSPGNYINNATGSTSSYKYLTYESGQIHTVVIGPLTPNTLYYYRCSSNSAREYTLKTTPSQLPIKFAVAGDLGQTVWTKTTLDHISKSNYDILLLPGDLSYADMIQPLWDSFGLLVEPLASQRPWMVTQGNHEVETIPILHTTKFTAYNARWQMPFQESGSGSNLYYSFNAGDGAVHVIMLGSYTDFDSNSAQYKWLQADLGNIDREKTPWVILMLHAPWYNTNTAHQGEPQSIYMKNFMESLLYNARVDVVFAGHVHAYERFTRVYKGKADNCGPIYITIGDGGNREGLATEFIEPKPEISVFREASFGYGELEVVNTSHAIWRWHRNEDDKQVSADSIWVSPLSSDPACKR